MDNDVIVYYSIDKLYQDFTKTKSEHVLSQLKSELLKYFSYLANKRNMSDISFIEDVIETSIFTLLERVLSDKLLIKNNFLAYATKVFENTANTLWKKYINTLCIDDLSEESDLLKLHSNHEAQLKQYLRWIQKFLTKELSEKTFENQVIKFVLFSKKSTNKFIKSLPDRIRLRLHFLKETILNEADTYF